MPIKTLGRSLRRLGRIRAGTTEEAQDGTKRPTKLGNWRLTSPDGDLLEAAAGLYGGTVEPWSHPASDDRFQLLTTSETIDVVVPPIDMAFNQYMELWTAAGLQRRCNGEVTTDGEHCICQALATDEVCKPTTRLFVILPRLPDVGTWQLQTNGYYAATELAGAVAIIQRADGLVPADLRLQQRHVKREVEGKPITYRFAVPVLRVKATPASLMARREASAAELMTTEADEGVVFERQWEQPVSGAELLDRPSPSDFEQDDDLKVPAGVQLVSTGWVEGVLRWALKRNLAESQLERVVSAATHRTGVLEEVWATEADEVWRILQGVAAGRVEVVWGDDGFDAVPKEKP